MIIYHRQAEFIPVLWHRLYVQMLINAIHINVINERKHLIISIDSEKL